MDLPECLMGLDYIATESVRQLHRMSNSFFEKSSANANFVMVCRSQGVIHVRNALLDYHPNHAKQTLEEGICAFWNRIKEITRTKLALFLQNL